MTLLTSLIVQLLPLVAVPNSDQNQRCLVNLGGYAVSHEAKQWANAPLVTDLSVRHGTAPDASSRLKDVLRLIRQTNPEALVGRYASGRRVESVMKQHPPEAISASRFPDEWLRPGTNFVDLSNDCAAGLFADQIIAEVSHPPTQLVFLDNGVHPSALRGAPSWRDTCRFLGRIKDGLNENGILLIANIAIAPWGMPDWEVQLLSDAVDGMAFEMPFHRNARGNRERTRSLIATYRTWLSAGKIVVFIPVLGGAPSEAEKIREARFMAGFAMLIREPGDRLFVSAPFWQPEPDWAHWPKSFGKPLGDWHFEANQMLVRRFEHCALRVDPWSRSVTCVSFSECTTGPGVVRADECGQWDLDGDCDVDLQDYAVWMIAPR